MIVFRSLLFYFFYCALGFWFSLTGVLLWWAPFNFRFRYIRNWNRGVLFFARWVSGIKVSVSGLENIPEGACVVMCKHQSEWETLYLQTLFTPLSTILKEELLRIPFYGWGLRQLEPIAIDRESPRDALRKVQADGQERLAMGRSVLVFPEGTRVLPGESRRYARSGANLAISAQVPLLPIAHNAGQFWPTGSILIKPGTIYLSIGKAILTDENSDAKVLTEQVEQWVENESNRLYQLGR